MFETGPEPVVSIKMGKCTIEGPRDNGKWFITPLRDRGEARDGGDAEREGGGVAGSTNRRDQIVHVELQPSEAQGRCPEFEWRRSF